MIIAADPPACLRRNQNDVYQIGDIGWQSVQLEDSWRELFSGIEQI
jgi:hypothetical protein